ncbi:Cytochrome [Abeliophyllum distichum]|uniref:Cytochrome n=1 Tax=Abeliophyllum distichum TaxID=126358 RepID=A0ABD1V3B6_9LAMI
MSTFRSPQAPPSNKKTTKGLESVVGMERILEESNLKNVEYLDMVVKETLKLHHVAPLLLPHRAMQDGPVNGFHIPNQSCVIINTWAIGLYQLVLAEEVPWIVVGTHGGFASGGTICALF